MPDSSDTNAVRASEQLDWDALAAYARPKLQAVLGDEFDESAPLTVEQFHAGHSNLTYLLRFGEQEFVMRRPPFGPFALKAHDMAREYRILEAVHPVFPLAPRPFRPLRRHERHWFGLLHHGAATWIGCPRRGAA
jgi:aminoglycoside phosphotransferase (APT) family kinase protein